MKRQKVIELDCAEKKKLDIDWKDALGEEEVPELEIIGSDKYPVGESTVSGDDSAVWARSLSESDLDEQLRRQKSLLTSFGDKLPDKGEKIRNKIGNLEYEKQRRMFQPRNMDVDGCQILEHSKSSDVFRQGNSALKDTSRQGNTGSKDTFGAHCSENSKREAQSVEPCKDELRDLGHETWKSKADRDSTTKKSKVDRGSITKKSKAGRDSITKKSNGWRFLDKCQISDKNFYSGFKDPKVNRKPSEAYVKRKPSESSPFFLVDDDDDDVIEYETPREWSLQASPSQNSSCRKKSDDKVINLDEDEPQSPMAVEETFELPEGLPEDICYPSRDDPDHVQVSLKDLKCLSPREYLTSPVINFYIRFLQHQVFSENQTAADCHFFNTFFYKKLIEAVSYKGNDKDAFFVKLRRWWRGFDLFRKSYIFIPIHEDVHWSLVIICIPDKEDESGLTILHLDSLGLHPTKAIFNNVKRFLLEEWNYLNQDDPSLDLPISEKIWSDLPDRINEAEVQVPQQKNDYDCGLFVLFFIRRFIEEAPQRLKLKDLEMIHKKWFKPDEASALRFKIWNKLIDLFQNSNQTD